MFLKDLKLISAALVREAEQRIRSHKPDSTVTRPQGFLDGSVGATAEADWLALTAYSERGESRELPQRFLTVMQEGGLVHVCACEDYLRVFGQLSEEIKA